MSVRGVERIDVHSGEVRIGELARTRLGARFTYDEAHVARHRGDPLRAVAFAMPVRDATYEITGANLHPFFAGLLPEGLRLKALVRAVKTSEDDLFSLLVAVGTDTVGDVSATLPGGRPEARSPMLGPDAAGAVPFRELFERSLSFAGEGEYGAVSGVQPKVSAAMISFPVRARGSRRECLLKLSPSEFPRLVENEAFFMALAADAGLAAARVEVICDVTGESGLLVERFDRVARADGSVARVHQEDACQLLDRYPADKYRLSLRDVSEALDVCSAPVVERLRLLRMQALSYAIAGGDMHAKNVSVQTVEGRVSLTPVYDVLSTLPYGDRKLAISMEGRDDRVRARDFLAFGERVGVRPAATVRMLRTLVRSVGPWIDRLPEIGLPEKQTQHLAGVMQERLGLLTPDPR